MIGDRQVLAAIWAESLNGVIGKDGGIPWYLPEDLAHFQRTTECGSVIMGRRTWESLPEPMKTEPGRRSRQYIVVSSKPVEGALTASNLPEALLLTERAYIWVIGGERLLSEALHLATMAIVTFVDIEVEGGDTFAPEFPRDCTWELANPGVDIQTSSTGLHWLVSKYYRRRVDTGYPI